MRLDKALSCLDAFWSKYNFTAPNTSQGLLYSVFNKIGRALFSVHTILDICRV